MSTTNLNIISREVWSADPPRSRQSLQLPVTYVFCAMSTRCEPCTDTEHCQSLIREMQFEHAQMEKLPDIKYNFLIGGDGKIYEGRGWNLAPSLPPKYADLNNKSIYIGFIGNLYGETVTPDMVKVRDELLTHSLVSKYVNLKFLVFLLYKTK